MLSLIILTRILFVACMVFIIGYVFGNFSKNATLRIITKIASMLVIALFIAANIFFFRFGWHHQTFAGRYNCGWPVDSTTKK
jgi:hypothetical protein